MDHVDEYFGLKVADPYRWLEQLGSPEVNAWIEAQNAYSAGRIAALRGYERIRARLEQLWTTERMSVPSVHDHLLIDEFAELYAFFADALGM